MKKSILMFIVLTLVCPVIPAMAGLGGATPPYTINYQGFLADNSGAPLADGDYEITFRLYDALTGGTALWSETWNGVNLVTVENGRFNVKLGQISLFESANLDFSFSKPYYLEIQVGSDTAFAPRLALTAVPYAMQAKYLEGHTVSVAGAYAVTAKDDVVMVDTTISAAIITLPAVSGVSGRKFTIKRVQGENNVTILPSGSDLINGTVSLTLPQTGDAVQLVGYGTNWQAVAAVGSFLVTADGDDVGAGVTSTDLIVNGSECIGSDCVNGESFGFDTLMLKENNLRIYFNDTSNAGSFPNNDWRLTANDSTDGGRNYFSIDDVTNGMTGLVVEAGGDVGIGTSDTPRGKLEVMTYETATGTLSTSSLDGTGTVAIYADRSVYGTGTAFTTELAVGGAITVGGETQMITYIYNDTQLAVEDSWSSTLSNVPFTYVGKAITGTGTAFTTELNVGSYIVVGGTFGKVAAIGSDTALTLESAFGRVLSGLAFKVQNTGLIVTRDGSAGVGTSTPDEKFEVEFGDANVDAEIGRGTTDTDVTFLTLRSPNGTKFYITVDDAGNLSASTTKP